MCGHGARHQVGQRRHAESHAPLLPAAPPLSNRVPVPQQRFPSHVYTPPYCQHAELAAGVSGPDTTNPLLQIAGLHAAGQT